MHVVEPQEVSVVLVPYVVASLQEVAMEHANHVLGGLVVVINLDVSNYNLNLI
jgi:hypothetical protein